MRDFEQRMATMRSRADDMQEKIAEVSVRVESEEGEVAVTVSVGGALTGTEFGPEARRVGRQGVGRLDRAGRTARSRGGQRGRVV